MFNPWSETQPIVNLLFVAQEKEKELLKTDWRIINFDQGEIRLTSNNVIFMCPIANHDDDVCNFAICEGCETKHKWKGRSRYKRKKECEHNMCRHQFRNLSMAEKPFWVGRNWINRNSWKNKPKGCVCCKQKFVGDYA